MPMSLSNLRQGRITGSRIAAALGISPFQTKEDLIKEMLYGSTFKGNAATDYGKFHEEYAIADCGFPVVPSNDAFVQHPEYDWLGCTPDGYINDDAIIEIKCPFSAKDDPDFAFKSIYEQPHYYAQIQLQMACTGRKVCYFYQWSRFNSRVDVVRFDPDWWAESLDALAEFMDEVADRKAEHYHEDYLAALERFESAKEDLETIKDQMIKLTDGNRWFGDKVKVTKVEKRGTIKYKSALDELCPDADLEKYRSKPTSYYKFTTQEK